jgi:hypothetical protein
MVATSVPPWVTEAAPEAIQVRRSTGAPSRVRVVPGARSCHSPRERKRRAERRERPGRAASRKRRSSSVKVRPRVRSQRRAMPKRLRRSQEISMKAEKGLNQAESEVRTQREATRLSAGKA